MVGSECTEYIVEYRTYGIHHGYTHVHVHVLGRIDTIGSTCIPPHGTQPGQAGAAAHEADDDLATPRAVVRSSGRDQRLAAVRHAALVC